MKPGNFPFKCPICSRRDYLKCKQPSFGETVTGKLECEECKSVFMLKVDRKKGTNQFILSGQPVYSNMRYKKPKKTITEKLFRPGPTKNES